MKISFLALFTFLSGLHLGAQADSIPALDPRLTDYEYAYPTDVFTFNSQQQELEMVYMDQLPTGEANGRTIVLLHGKNFNGAYWGETMTFLLEQGYRVIVPDQIGFGKSSKPDYYQYTFQQLAHNTKALLDTPGRRFHRRTRALHGRHAGYPLRPHVPRSGDGADPGQSHRTGGLEAKSSLPDDRSVVRERTAKGLRVHQGVHARRAITTAIGSPATSPGPSCWPAGRSTPSTPGSRGTPPSPTI